MQTPFPPVNRPTLIALLQRELNPSRLIPSVTAGLISGVLLVIYAISLAALIFSGSLSQYVSIGIGYALFTTVSVNVLVALLSSVPGAVVMPQDAPAIIMALMASNIAAQLPAAATGDEAVLTVVLAIALTTTLTGVFCFVLGTFKLGDLTRFIPYPVVGGFLAGTGWLLSMGALGLMADVPIRLDQLSVLFQPEILLRWVPGFCFAVLLLLVLRRYNHVLILPGLILGAIALFFLSLLATGTSIAEAQDYKLLLDSFPKGGLWQPLTLAILLQANWGQILGQTSQAIAIFLITAIALLLNATGIELATRRDVDLNRELRTTGIANIVAGFGGGIIGFHSLGVSVLSVSKIGAKSRLVGLIAAAVGFFALSVGASAIELFPKPVLGGVALLLGLGFLVEWVIEGWFKFSKPDYFIILLILAVIASVGFLEGVGVGLLVSIALFVVTYGQVNVAKHTLSGTTYQSHAARSVQQQRMLETEGNQIYILELQGFLFFGTANRLLNQIRQRLQQSPLRFVVFSFRFVTGLDSSAVLSFNKLQQIAQQQQFSLVFTHLSPTIQRQMQMGDILKADVSLCQVFPDLDRGVEWCENQILDTIPQRRQRSLPLALQLNELFTQTEHVSAFMDYLEEQDRDSGEIVFHQGEPADALYLIELGQVTLLQNWNGDQTRRLQSLGAGNLVGEMDFFSQSPHQTSAIIDQPSTLYRLSYEAMMRMRHEQPTVAVTFQEFVISLLRDRLSSTYREVADLLQ